MSTVFQFQKQTLLIVRKIEIVTKMLSNILYSHERSQAILRKELKKLSALRDSLRARVKRMIDKEYKSFEGMEIKACIFR